MPVRFSSQRPWGDHRGFSLVETLVALGVTLVLAGALAPMAFKWITAVRIDKTQQRMQEIWTAMVGSDSTFQGFVGDIGRWPGSLVELISNQNALPSFAVNNTTGVGSGWRGPYLIKDADGQDPLADGWGVPFSYNSTTGQLTSYGPDHAFGGGDDIVLPETVPPTLRGTLLVTVYVNDIPNPFGLTVTVWDTVDGAQVPATNLISSGELTLKGFAYNLIQGIHAVKAVHTGTHVTGNTTETFAVQKVISVVIKTNTQTKLTIHLTTSADVYSQ